MLHKPLSHLTTTEAKKKLLQCMQGNMGQPKFIEKHNGKILSEDVERVLTKRHWQYDLKCEATQVDRTVIGHLMMIEKQNGKICCEDVERVLTKDTGSTTISVKRHR